MVNKLNSKNALSDLYIGNLFYIGRTISPTKIGANIYVDIIKQILDTGISILKKEQTSELTKKYFLYQLKRFQNYYLIKIEVLAPLFQNYKADLNLLIKDYVLEF